MVDLPVNFEVREAVGNSDCFFDSVAQGLKQVNPEFNFTPKSLREICKRFAQSQLQDEQSWLKEALKTKQELIYEYVTGIEFTANDFQQESGAVNMLGFTQPIWGRSEIEGRILCEEYEVKLHVVQKGFVGEEEIWTHQIVDSNGSRSVDAVNYNKEENMVHVMNTGCLHFHPILKYNVQHNYCSHHNNDMIKTERSISEVLRALARQNTHVKIDNGTGKTTDLEGEVCKDKEKLQDKDWYVKNLYAAQTEGYEVELAMWFLLVGKEKIEKKEIKSFYLASDIIEALRFGHIVFKYQKEGCTSKVTFLEAKHKENEHKEETGSVKFFDLSDAWKAYEKIRGCFTCNKIDNRIFGEDFSDVDCSFIFFTNALPNIPYVNIQEKTVDPDDILYFGKTHNYYYSLIPCEATDKIILNCDSSSKKEELNEFLGQLEFFFGQPNEKELSKFIKQRIKSQYSVKEDDVDLVFTSVKNKIQEWHGRKRIGEFLTNHNRFFEDTVRVSIKFDVKEPVRLFTGRDRELESLHKILQNTGEAVISQAVSVTSLGGVGKTELARKYISEYSKEYDDNVIWINAENYSTIDDSFGRVAEDKLGINVLDEKGIRKKTEIIAEEVYEFFARMHRKSLFIFDNSVKYRGYEEKDTRIDKFLPTGRDKLHVLITSRDQEWGKKTLTLNVFSKEEAAEFIRKALKDIDDVENSKVKRLAAKLLFLPLALTQAVACIKMENQSLDNIEEERFSIGDYLELFKEKTWELSSKGISKIFDRYTATVMTTWQITIEKMKQKKLHGERALNILNIAAYIAPNKIFFDVIFGGFNGRKFPQPAVELLDQYSMASLLGGEMEVHGLVQQVTRIELEGQGKNKNIDVVEQTFLALKGSFPHGRNKLDDISKKKKLLPHLEMILSHLDNLIARKPKDVRSMYCKNFIRELLTWMADGCTDLWDPKRKQELLERALSCFENHYGPNHPHVIATLLDLGNAYGVLGDHHKKKQLLERALKLKEDNYGPKHIEVACVLENLGVAYTELGDPCNGKDLIARALKIKEDHYGPTHSEVAKTNANLGMAHQILHDFAKQKELLKRTLKILEDYYGPNHLEVAIVLKKLGIVYGQLDDPFNAKKRLERALKILEDHYGPYHFEVGSTLSNLGIAHGKLGDPYKKKELIERALRINLNHYGRYHLEVAMNLTNLAGAYRDLGDHGMRREVLKEALPILLTHYGPDHTFVSKVSDELG